MRSPYTDLPLAAFWRSGVARAGGAPRDLYERKWPITLDDRVATAGSCFAQHIGRNLRKHGFGIMDLEPPPPRLDPALHATFGYGMYSARYGNIYVVRQLLQLALEALGKTPTHDIVWQDDKGRFFDALRPGVEPDGLSSAGEVIAHRSRHLAAVRQMLETVDVFVFTLGLTEAWVHRSDGTVYPTAPGTIAGIFDPNVYVFHNFTFDEIYADLLAFIGLMDELRGRGRLRYLLTVSPVPLTATASGNHVMTATTYSKAVLRAVAGQLADGREEVDYFPSFEIVSNPWTPQNFYEQNLRSVRKEGVEAVMRIFASAHLGVAAQPGAELENGPIPSTPDDELKCEEELLDAFSVSQ